MPSFIFLSEAEIAQENNDSPEEVTLAEKLVAQRAEILRSHEEKESNKAVISASAMALGGSEELAPDNTETKGKVKRGSAKAKASPSKGKKVAGKSRRSKLKEETAEAEIGTPALDSEDGYDTVSQRKFGFHILPQPSSRSLHTVATAPIINQYPQHQYQLPHPLPIEPQVTVRHSNSSVVAESSVADPPHPHLFSPYRKSPSKRMQDKSHRPSSRLHPVAPRSMLQRKFK